MEKIRLFLTKVQKPPALIVVIVLAILAVAAAAFLLARPKTAPTTTGQAASQASRADRLVRADSYQRGDANAPVTIVEFVDFQCEACAYMSPITTRILNEYQGKVRLVIRYWPLNQHKNAQAAVSAAEAAGELGKYWEMYDKLMTNRQQWSQTDNPWPIFVKYAQDLDLAGFPTDFEAASTKSAGKVDRDGDDAQELKLKGVPNFFINGRDHGYIQSYEEFKQKIEAELAS